MLLKRIKKEIAEFEKHIKAQGIDYVYNQAYYIAIMTELEWFFTEYLNPEQVENDYSPLNKVSENVCESILDYYKQCNHPERYDVFFGGIAEIIDDFIKIKKL